MFFQCRRELIINWRRIPRYNIYNQCRLLSNYTLRAIVFWPTLLYDHTYVTYQFLSKILNESRPLERIFGSSFPGVERPGRFIDHPPLSTGEVKEMVELYIYYPSVSPWRIIELNVLCRTFPCILSESHLISPSGTSALSYFLLWRYRLQMSGGRQTNLLEVLWSHRSLQTNVDIAGEDDGPFPHPSQFTTFKTSYNLSLCDFLYSKCY
jgi:hypothetical protein